MNNKKAWIIGGVVVILIVIFFVWCAKNLGDEKRWGDSTTSQNFTPVLNKNIPAPLTTAINNITASSYMSTLISTDGSRFVLASKNPTDPFPIASITKLMTALVASNLLRDDTVITISPEAAAQPQSAGRLSLTPGESDIVAELMKPLLIESSNDAAYALAEKADIDRFVKEMNEKAQRIGMQRTQFVNPHGLDTPTKLNTSTAEDLLVLMQYLKNNHPNILATTARATDIFTPIQAHTSTTLRTTNALISSSTLDFPYTLFGAKTGETPKAKQTLITAIEAPNGRGYIVSVVLDSEDRFGDMISLVNWATGSYNW